MLYLFLALAILAHMIFGSAAALYVMSTWAVITLFIFTYVLIAALTSGGYDAQ